MSFKTSRPLHAVFLVSIEEAAHDKPETQKYKKKPINADSTDCLSNNHKADRWDISVAFLKSSHHMYHKRWLVFTEECQYRVQIVNASVL